MIIYEGPSLIDGGPIVGVLTGIKQPSTNRKTGPMLQLWILREDCEPIEALRNGTDESVCGDCPLRGMAGKRRGCYVSIGQAVTTIWRKYRDGGYPRRTFREAMPRLRARPIRLGAYGDPVAMPAKLLRQLIRICGRHTGYTHLWRDFPRLKDILMASVESEDEMKEAHAKGWRTYRIVESFTDITAVELECLNTTKDLLCYECTLCDGNKSRGKSIAIEVHGGDGAEGFVFQHQAEIAWER